MFWGLFLYSNLSCLLKHKAVLVCYLVHFAEMLVEGKLPVVFALFSKFLQKNSKLRHSLMGDLVVSSGQLWICAQCDDKGQVPCVL